MKGIGEDAAVGRGQQLRTWLKHPPDRARRQPRTQRRPCPAAVRADRDAVEHRRRVGSSSGDSGNRRDMDRTSAAMARQPGVGLSPDLAIKDPDALPHRTGKEAPAICRQIQRCDQALVGAL